MTQTTIEKAVGQVHQMSDNNYDEIVPVQEMEFDSLNQMTISGRRVEILPSAQRLLSDRLRVPFSYLTRCPADLQARNLNYWIEQERQQRETFFCRFNSDQLRAVFTGRFVPIDHMEVLTKMLEYGFDPGAEVHLSLDNEIMVLKVPDHTRLFKVSENDGVIPGISISNSETGWVALTIEAFYYRSVFTNGMIAKTAVDALYKHISRRVLDEFPLVLKNVVYQSSHIQDRFQISVRTPVENPESTIDTFVRQFQIPQQQAEIVKQAFYLEQRATMFHIIQAFTSQDNQGKERQRHSYQSSCQRRTGQCPQSPKT